MAAGEIAVATAVTFAPDVITYSVCICYGRVTFGFSRQLLLRLLAITYLIAVAHAVRSYLKEG